MSAIAISCKAITRAVRKAGIAGLYGLAGTENTTGDAVKKLDVLSNDITIKTLEVRKNMLPPPLRQLVARHHSGGRCRSSLFAQKYFFMWFGLRPHFF